MNITRQHCRISTKLNFICKTANLWSLCAINNTSTRAASIYLKIIQLKINVEWKIKWVIVVLNTAFLNIVEHLSYHKYWNTCFQSNQFSYHFTNVHPQWQKDPYSRLLFHMLTQMLQSATSKGWQYVIIT